MIEIANLNQQYGGSQILWDINMSIPTGSRTCIMGRNGVGKTTLLKCLMGLIPSSSGDMLIDGK
jgi:urea transport system ATP-binding protein